MSSCVCARDFFAVVLVLGLTVLPLRAVLASGDHDHGHEHHDDHPHDAPDAPDADENDGDKGHDAHDGHGEHDEHAGHDAHDEHDEHDEHDDHDDHGAEARVFTVAELERFGVRTATAGPGVVDDGIELPAEVRPDADRLAHVAPRFPGIVRDVKKHVGDRVQAGDVLAIIESENLATYELKVAFDGIVIDKHITPGEAVSRDRPAYIVADLSTVWVHINVYQKALPEIRIGQSVKISTWDGQLEADGTLSYIAPIVDQATRTATARVVLPNDEGDWRPGLFVSATVARPVDAGVVVPRRALHTMDGERVVFVAENDSFSARPVSVGAVGRTSAEIIAGLSAGERFADEGSFLVKTELGKGSGEHHH